MNSSGYIFLLAVVISLIAIAILFIKFKRGKGIKFSKNISIKSQSTSLDDSKEDLGKEVINEIRAPKQAELDLPDENENKFMVFYLQSKIDARPNLDSLKTKMYSNGLIFKDGYFQSATNDRKQGFKVINVEEPGTFSSDKDISLLAIGLHLKGQKDVEKTFDLMINLGKNLEHSFDMKLLDDNFNKMTDQTIGNYRENANAIDLKLGSYVN